MFEDVPGSFCGTASSSSESVGLCFFAFGKSLGFFTSAVVFFPSVFVDFLFFVATLNGYSRDFGSTASDSSSENIGTCTDARSDDLGLCRLRDLPDSSSARTRPRNLDRCRCLPFCGDWSSLSSLIGIGFS